jgi:OmpA-OmpF porin, OOP family
MRNPKKLILVCTLSALSVASSFNASAQMTGSPSTSASETSRSSWIPYTSYGYVGASVGRTNYDLGGCIAFSCDDQATGFKLYTGGRFSRYVGIELGYVNLGDADRNGGEIKAQGANLSLVGNIPLGDNFNIFGKVGGIYSWTKTSSFVPAVRAGKEDGLGLSYGLGMQYDINRSFAVRADWDRYRLKYVGQREDADLFSVGVVFKF